MRLPLRIAILDGWAVSMSCRKVSDALLHMASVRYHYGNDYKGGGPEAFHLFPNRLVLDESQILRTRRDTRADIYMRRR